MSFWNAFRSRTFFELVDKQAVRVTRKLSESFWNKFIPGVHVQETCRYDQGFGSSKLREQSVTEKTSDHALLPMLLPAAGRPDCKHNNRFAGTS
jgi:hypothetical protein